MRPPSSFVIVNGISAYQRYMCLPCVLAVTVEMQSAKAKVQFLPLSGHLSVRWSAGRKVDSCSCTASSLPSSPFCHAGRVIATDNGQVSSESCFCRNACPIQCMYSKIDRNGRFYLSVICFGTGYSRTILLPPSYHIKIGLEFPTMQFCGAHPLF
jgi:hypothetical protein